MSSRAPPPELDSPKAQVVEEENPSTKTKRKENSKTVVTADDDIRGYPV